jgi:hypothetical protein
MLRLILGQALGAYLSTIAASGRHPRLVSAALALVTPRMGGAGKWMDIWGADGRDLRAQGSPRLKARSFGHRFPPPT